MRKVVVSAVAIIAMLTGSLVYFGPNYAQLTLERKAGGVIVNPVYSVTINGKGDVDYDGARAMVVGTKSGTAKANLSRKIIIDFIKLNPLKLKDEYKSSTNNQTQPMRLTFQFLFYKKTIDFDEITAPSKLVDLADSVDKVSKSDKWVFPENM